MLRLGRRADLDAHLGILDLSRHFAKLLVDALPDDGILSIFDITLQYLVCVKDQFVGMASRTHSRSILVLRVTIEPVL